MGKEPLVFAIVIHDHQPLGTFNSVIQETYDKAYLPFFRRLFDFPDVRFSVHISGYLLEWLSAGGTELLEILKTMVQRNQTEILTGTHYESIISLVPECDAVNSMKAYSDRLGSVFGIKPRGMWVVQGVYEPNLPQVLSRAGVEYTILDDWHFRTVGITGTGFYKPWLAEAELESITIFPASGDLRRSVSYGVVEDVVAYLRGLYENGAAFVCLAEDGAKFGGSPETAVRYYDDGWLDGFFAALTEAGDWLRTALLSEAYDLIPAAGPVYLPSMSDCELGRWALPTDDQAAVETLGGDFAEDGPYGYLVPGAPVRNFLVRYPEANYIHKRMELTSRRLAELEAGGNEKPDARRRLWRAQANDAYWHGVSGGLYLPNLRRAVMENVLAAERLVDEEISMGTFSDAADFDYDGNVEITLKDRRQVLVLAPNEGLAAKEWSFYEGPVCLTAVLGRRPEPYHDKIRAVRSGTVNKETRLENLLVYDKTPHRLLLDSFLPSEVTETDFWFQTLPDYAPPVPIDGPLFEKGTSRGTTVGGVKAAFLLTGANGDVRLSKNVSPVETGLYVEWEYEARAVGRLGTGLSLALVSPESVFAVSSKGGTEEIGLKEHAVSFGEKLFVSDDFADWKLDVESDRSVDVWQYPIFTVTASKNGFEELYQGAAFFLSFTVGEGETGIWTLNLTVDI
jgi:hypothetical protein